MAFFVYGSYSAAQGFGLVKGLLAYQHELSNQGTISINFKMEGEVSINGVKIVAKILNIPEPQISFFDPKEGSNTEITGMYLFESDEIIFNEVWIEKSPWIEVIVTAFHETRHAYQGYCIRNRTMESKDTLDKWEYETLNYIRPTGKNNEVDDHDYLNQSIEIDAIGFTHHKINEFFGVKTIIPNSIKDIALNYQKNNL